MKVIIEVLMFFDQVQLSLPLVRRHCTVLCVKNAEVF